MEKDSSKAKLNKDRLILTLIGVTCGIICIQLVAGGQILRTHFGTPWSDRARSTHNNQTQKALVQESTTVTIAGDTGEVQGTQSHRPQKAGLLEIYSEPNDNADVIYYGMESEKFPILSSESGWYEILLPTGEPGWMPGYYTE